MVGAFEELVKLQELAGSQGVVIGVSEAVGPTDGYHAVSRAGQNGRIKDVRTHER